MSEQEQKKLYNAGDIENGYIWTGTAWLPLAQGTPTPRPPAPPTTADTGRSVARIVGAVFAFLAAAFFGLLGYQWMNGFNELDKQGNQFAGLLGLFALGAFAVAGAFGLAGVFLVQKKS